MGSMKVIAYVIAILFISFQSGCAQYAKAPSDPTADNLTLTTLSAPLPREAFKATISFAYGPPSKFRAGEARSIHLLIRNSSGVLWPYDGAVDGKYQVRVGNRWLGQDGTAMDGGRGLLSYDLRPADTEEVAITVNAPKLAGEYTLEFDMVQEQVAWFRDMGSEPLRTRIVVE
jgi:hypothetical protein